MTALVDLVDEQATRTGSGLAVTPAQVARRAGVATSTLYNRFPGGIGELASEVCGLSAARQVSVHPHISTLASLFDVSNTAAKDQEARLRSKVNIAPSSEDISDDPSLAHLLYDLEEHVVANEDLPTELRARAALKAAEGLKYNISTADAHCVRARSAVSLFREVGDSSPRELAAALLLLSNSLSYISPRPDQELREEQYELLAEYVKLADPDMPGYWWVRFDRDLAHRSATGTPFTAAAMTSILNRHLDFLEQHLPAEHSAGPSVRLELCGALCTLRQLSLIEASVLDRGLTLIGQMLDANESSSRSSSSWLHRLMILHAIDQGQLSSIDDLAEMDLFPWASHGTLWAPNTVVIRRLLGASSTRTAERHFIDYVTNTLYLTAPERDSVAAELSIDLDQAKETDILPEDDPAASLIASLRSLLAQVMLVQPQSPMLRKEGRKLAALLGDEFLDPV